jgi:FMN phosphatase YigB (HAD superfamily)
MSANSAITQVIFDFDGTCTQVPAIFEAYLDLYRRGLVKSGFDVSEADWRDHQQLVRQHSPRAGWMLGGCPAAPVAADPYILADETAKLILRIRKDARPLPNVNAEAYAAAAAPWREDALETFSRLAERGVRIAFVSNSSSAYITGRIEQLVGSQKDLRDHISVQSDAGKFRICELSWPNPDISAESAAVFAGLAAAKEGLLERPIYLRRGAYFEAINKVLAGDMRLLSSTLFCGDIFEMDLAMPAELGARVHLIDRAAPFETYPYEQQALAACGPRGNRSADLAALLGWFDEAALPVN